MEFELSHTFNATPKEIYNAWLSSEIHSGMTGGEANCSDAIGDTFSAWNDYITGVNLELVPFSKIVQKWRTTEFEENDEDSIIEVTLKETEQGTTLTLNHTRLPKNGEQYINGWKEHYFKPMSDFFG